MKCNYVEAKVKPSKKKYEQKFCDSWLSDLYIQAMVEEDN